jgi:ABC-2 type transport system permease protein
VQLEDKKMVSIIRLYIHCCKNSLSKHMQYRFDFLFGLVVSFIIAFSQPAIQFLFYKGVNGFDGWNTNQIIVFQGVMMFWMGLKDTLLGNIRSDLQIMILDGSFDRLLNKPYSVLILIFTGGFNFLGIGPLIAGTTVLIYSTKINNLKLGFYHFISFLILMIFGLILYLSILIIYCSVLIHLVSMNRMEEILEKFLRFSEYPLNIYPSIAQWFLILLMPLSLWVYYPAQILLDRFDNMGYISLLMSILIFFTSKAIFKKSLMNYTSTGG